MKYRISLAENYNLPGPFVTDWNLELIGDALREEFEVYFDKYKKDIGYVEGSSKTLIVPLILQRFMNLKKISLVEDPASGGLISRFVLKKNEIKLVDERTANALHVFKKREVINAKGEFESWLGFMNIDPVGKPVVKQDTPVIQNVIGEDIDYFAAEKDEEEYNTGINKANLTDYPNLEKVKISPKDEKAKTVLPTDESKPVYYCDKCKKEFNNRGLLKIHLRTHKVKE